MRVLKLVFEWTEKTSVDELRVLKSLVYELRVL